MNLPFVIDNQAVTAAMVLNRLLARSRGCPVDVASAYFSITGFKLLKDALQGTGAFRLLLGHEPQEGCDLGLNESTRAGGISAELAAMPFDEATLRLVEDLIAFLDEDKVQVRLYS